jgi:paraquat-inducible protein A
LHPDNNTFEYFTACPDCDLLFPRKEAPEGHSIVCPRCGKTISKRFSDSIAKTLALSLAGRLMYLPAVLLPLMTFKSFGFSDSANILESIINFYLNDYYFVALMVSLSAVIFPLVLLTCIFVISFQLHQQRYPAYLSRLFRTYLHLEEWAMVEVYLLGIMITIIKMVDTSDIQYNAGIFCFTGLVLITLAISTVIDKNLFWETIEHRGPKQKTKSVTGHETLLQTDSTAAGKGLVLCHICHKLSPKSLEGSGCPRCGEALHSRKTSSIARTWALVLTSAIFLAPANLLPIMRIDYLGIPDRSTIMDGIIYFFHNGSYFIGLIIFTASVLVPVFKIIGLTILLLTSRPCGNYLLRQKARLYRFVAFIGKWSMLDIFVIALLTVLVDFGFFTSIYAAPAATYFCIVVASTMFAAITFDPRIMWDKCSTCDKTVSGGISQTNFDNTP